LVYVVERGGAEVESDIREVLDKITVEFVRKPSEAKGAECCRAFTGFKSIRSYEELAEALSRCKVVFVLITTTLCPYCQMFKPIFARVAKEFSGLAAFVEANADYVPEVAELFEVYSTPTTVTIVDRRAVDAVVGFAPYPYFRNYVEGVLRHSKCLSN
jgi:Thioredoxin domain-containing protein